MGKGGWPLANRRMCASHHRALNSCPPDCCLMAARPRRRTPLIAPRPPFKGRASQSVGPHQPRLPTAIRLIPRDKVKPARSLICILLLRPPLPTPAPVPPAQRRLLRCSTASRRPVRRSWARARSRRRRRRRHTRSSMRMARSRRHPTWATSICHRRCLPVRISYYSPLSKLIRIALVDGLHTPPASPEKRPQNSDLHPCLREGSPTLMYWDMRTDFRATVQLPHGVTLQSRVSSAQSIQITAFMGGLNFSVRNSAGVTFMDVLSHILGHLHQRESLHRHAFSQGS